MLYLKMLWHAGCAGHIATSPALCVRTGQEVEWMVTRAAQESRELRHDLLLYA